MARTSRSAQSIAFVRTRNWRERGMGDVACRHRCQERIKRGPCGDSACDRESGRDQLRDTLVLRPGQRTDILDQASDDHPQAEDGVLDWPRQGGDGSGPSHEPIRKWMCRTIYVFRHPGQFRT